MSSAPSRRWYLLVFAVVLCCALSLSMAVGAADAAAESESTATNDVEWTDNVEWTDRLDPASSNDARSVATGTDDGNVTVAAQTAPYGAIDADTDGAAIDDVTVQSNDTAIGDTVVVTFPGEHLELADDPNLSEAFELTVEDAGWYASPTWSLADDGITLHHDEDVGTVHASINISAVNDDDGSPTVDVSNYDVWIDANESSPDLDVQGANTTVSSFDAVDRTLEVTGEFHDSVLVLSNDPVTVWTTLAPGSEIRIAVETDDGTVDEATTTVDSDGTAAADLDTSELLPGVDAEVNASGTVLDETDDQVPGVVLPVEESVDRAALDDTTIYCCEPVDVTGFDPGEPVEIQAVGDDELLATPDADDDGAVTVVPSTLGNGTYSLVDEAGDAYGPVEIRSQSFDRFELDQSTVERGEQVNLTVESDREAYAFELFDAGGNVPPRTIESAIDAGTYAEHLDVLYVEVESGDRTVEIDTGELPQGTVTFVGAVIDADAAAHVSVEILDDVDERRETAVAPKDSVDPDHDPSTVRANLTERETVAIGDVAAVGLPADIDSTATATVESVAGNDTWSLDDDGVTLHTGDAPPVLTIDTDVAATPSFEGGTVYRTVVDDGDDRFTATFTVEQRHVTILAPVEDGDYQYPAEETVVTSHTNVAPGTRVFLRARSRSPNPFLMDATTAVEETGVARAEFNFSAREIGNDFIVTARETPDNTEDSGSAMFVENVDGITRIDGGAVNAADVVSVSGFAGFESVVVWRLDDGEQLDTPVTRTTADGEQLDTPVTRTTADGDGIVELHPGLLEPGDSYVLVDRYGTESAIFDAYEPHPLERYAGPDGRIELDGLRNAVGDWQTGEIDNEVLLAAVNAWRTGEPID